VKTDNTIKADALLYRMADKLLPLAVASVAALVFSAPKFF
jgi:hypothetical protein